MDEEVRQGLERNPQGAYDEETIAGPVHVDACFGFRLDAHQFPSGDKRIGALPGKSAELKKRIITFKAASWVN